MILDYLFRSLRGRFTVLAVVGFTLGLTAVALVGAAFMESAMKQEAEKSARGLLLQYANDIRADISRTSAVLQGVSHAAEAVAATDKPNRDLLGDILDRAVNAEKGLLGVSLVFEPQKLDGKDEKFVNHPNSELRSGRFATYLYRTGGQGVEIEKLDMADEAAKIWYQEPMYPSLYGPD